ncbi:uncharacterized protein LOC135489123 isoform X3 [Lineus longissimus]|uniref:uncharacterized protein LOC135489123 isoform X3 n=1 Tax=Lineus longissimus TaxID=88925 RepID=UPI002B4DE807
MLKISLISCISEQGIDEEVAVLLDDSTLRELVPRIGIRLKLKQLISLHLQGLKNYLRSTSDGRGLYDKLHDLGFAPRGMRAKLVRFAVGYLFEKSGRYPKSDEKNLLAMEMIEVFPFLKSPRGSGCQAFYQRARDTKPAKGFIHDRINNIRKQEAKTKGKKTKTTIITEDEGMTLTATINELEDDASPKEVEQMTAWLRHNIAPKERVRECMKKTAISRYRELSTNLELTIKSILESNPRLLDPGMIEQDYDCLFKNGDKLTKLWDGFFGKHIIEYASAGKRGNWREKLGVKDVLNEDEESVVALQLLPHILPPKPIKSSNVVHRPSNLEAANAFIRFKQATTNIPAFLDTVEGSVQPFILALGDRHNPSQSFVVVERNAVEQPSLLKAVDCCFKLFFVLDIAYPASCHIVWEFLQDLVNQLPVRKGQTAISKNVMSLRNYFNVD